ncbi:plastocyanin/azurin family copper-binding protein [Halomontanus rarus]|uniref:plastocyanin/azurin family copper-binding protein n=1 Tax=Halomontanus rarus TaxID=3034020 RepID=UPI0023E893BE|nr:plastocyanin/azurin family copper-binding protein [Halovivax sp. TS33]
MTRDTRFSRRSIVKLVGASAATAALAGCGGPEGDNETDGDETGANDTGLGADNETGGMNETEDNETDGLGNETEDNETDGLGNETEDNETADNETANETADNETAGNESAGNESASVSEEWQDVEEIELGGETAAWQGVAPAPIEGEENPTLELTEGTEYDITWENIDGQPHNIEIWDDNEEIVEDYQTEIIEEEGETQTLTFEATSEMAEYVCQVHVSTMIGDIEVQSG